MATNDFVGSGAILQIDKKLSFFIIKIKKTKTFYIAIFSKALYGQSNLKSLDSNVIEAIQVSKVSLTGFFKRSWGELWHCDSCQLSVTMSLPVCKCIHQHLTHKWPAACHILSQLDLTRPNSSAEFLCQPGKSPACTRSKTQQLYPPPSRHTWTLRGRKRQHSPVSRVISRLPCTPPPYPLSIWTLR